MARPMPATWCRRCASTDGTGKRSSRSGRAAVVDPRRQHRGLADLDGAAILTVCVWREGASREAGNPSEVLTTVTARCACGNTFKTHSTKPELHLEICSACHPFFTGRQKLIDTEGRVERFTKKFGAQTVAARKAGDQEGPCPPNRAREVALRFQVAGRTLAVRPYPLTAISGSTSASDGTTPAHRKRVPLPSMLPPASPIGRDAGQAHGADARRRCPPGPPPGAAPRTARPAPRASPRRRATGAAWATARPACPPRPARTGKPAVTMAS